MVAGRDIEAAEACWVSAVGLLDGSSTPSAENQRKFVFVFISGRAQSRELCAVRQGDAPIGSDW